MGDEQNRATGDYSPFGRPPRAGLFIPSITFSYIVNVCSWTGGKVPAPRRELQVRLSCSAKRQNGRDAALAFIRFNPRLRPLPRQDRRLWNGYPQGGEGGGECRPATALERSRGTVRDLD